MEPVGLKEVAEAVEGVFKVVEAHELESHTARGWQIVSVLPETKLESRQGKGVNPRFLAEMIKTDYSSLPEVIDTELSVPVNVHKYLLRKSINTKLDELNASLIAAAEEAVKAELEIEKLKGHNEEFARVSKIQKEEIEIRSKQASDSRDRERDMRNVKEAMENDIAAIRTAIGETRMKQIIDAEDDKPF